MPLDTALLASQKFRAQLLAKERASATRLVDAYGSIWVKLQSQIDLLAADIDAMDKAGTLKPWKVGKLDRLKALQRQVQDEINRYAVIVENEVTQGARAAIAQAQADARALTQAALPGVVRLDAAIMTRWQSLNPAAVESLLGFLQPDSPLMAGMRERFGAEIAQSIGDKLVQGIGLGYNPRKVASIIQGEMGQGLNSALRLSRTAQLYSYREATRAAYVANGEIVPGWEWRSARDGRSCMACVALDGTRYKNNETLNGHWQCRCTMLPDVIDYADLGLNVPRRKETIEYPTGEDWFSVQPEAMQKAMMGPGKFEAWKKGDIKLADLVHEQSDPVWGKMRSEASLKDIEAAKAEAAEKAAAAAKKAATAAKVPKASPAAASATAIKAEGDAATLLGSLPPEAQVAARQAGLKEVKLLNKRDYNKAVGNTGVRAGWESMAVTREDGTLLLRADNPNLVKTFHHELAHALDPMGADAKYKLSEHPDWLKASGWKADKYGRYKLRKTISNQPVSEYGGAAPWEDFAESFAKYTHGSKFDRRVMQGESEGRYEYMQKFAKELGFNIE